ncbi:hypothetical protein [Cupriavidus taiwanensis]|uniref:hypothetical protein n=1 Tax=Cupriavidus taiwanensis TaxID=164546 RepID=UPI000E172831|nr:hypothetical protein [Cupriavidus taiwanensis]SOY56028.1 hypothetical protein CBM2585_A60233 [Cupriavidus taiwanensis]
MSVSPAPRIGADELAALMAFPDDEAARKAFALYIRCDRLAASSNPVVLLPHEYHFLTSSADVSRPEIQRRARQARTRAQTAAWPFVVKYLAAPGSPPSFAQIYREADELKKTNYKETRKKLSEVFPGIDSERVDRKYFEEIRREFSTVLHLWMAHLIISRATGRAPDPSDSGQLLAFARGAEACAEYLGSIKPENRHEPPVDISALRRFSGIDP